MEQTSKQTNERKTKKTEESKEENMIDDLNIEDEAGLLKKKSSKYYTFTHI